MALAFAPDAKTLYVRTADAVLALACADSCAEARVFHEAGLGEGAGLAVDGSGRVYMTTDNGVAVLAPDGALLGTLEVDDAPTGLALATDAHLYVTTAGGRLLRVPVRRGVRPADVVAS